MTTYSYDRRAADKTATPYEENQKAMVREAGKKLQDTYSKSMAKVVVDLTKAVSGLKSFHVMVEGSRDMVKDALLALEEGGALPKLDDDTFSELQYALSKKVK